MRGLTATSRDVPPYSIIDWQHRLRGVNSVGLRRAGFDEQRIREIKGAYRILFRKGRNLALAIRELEANNHLAPDVIAVGRIDQLDGHPDPVLRLLHASFHHQADVQSSPDLPHVAGRSLEGQHRS